MTEPRLYIIMHEDLWTMIYKDTGRTISYEGS